MSHDVFLSYSTKDKPVADAICARLESVNIRCWIAPRDILPGATWGEAIINAINSSRMLILVFSSNSNASQQVLREVERGVSKGLIILPVRVEDIKPSGAMEYFLSSQHWIDVMTPAVESQISALIQNVSTILNSLKGKPSPKPLPKVSPSVPAPSSSLKVGILVGGIIFILMVGVGLYLSMGRGSRGANPPSQASLPLPSPNLENPSNQPENLSPGQPTPLHDAAESGDLDKVENLLKNGAQIEEKNESGQTPLHSAVIEEKLSVTKMLLAKGAKVNAKDNDGFTPLHFAAMGGNKELVEILLAKGADVSAKSGEGETALDSTRHEKIKVLLRARGAKSAYSD